MAVQDDLFDDPRAGDKLHVQREQRDFRDVQANSLRRVTSKELAFALDLDPTTVENAYYSRDRKAAPSTWLPRLVALDPEVAALHWLAERNGFRLVPEERRTDAQIVAETRAYLERMGPAGFAIIDALKLNRK